MPVLSRRGRVSVCVCGSGPDLSLGPHPLAGCAPWARHRGSVPGGQRPEAGAQAREGMAGRRLRTGRESPPRPARRSRPRWPRESRPRPRCPTPRPGCLHRRPCSPGQARVRAQRRRDGDPALLVGGLVGGAGSNTRWKSRTALDDRGVMHLRGEPLEVGHREDVEAAFLASGDRRVHGQLVAKLRRQEQPALLVEARGVRAEKHGPPHLPNSTQPEPNSTLRRTRGTHRLRVAPPYSTFPHFDSKSLAGRPSKTTTAQVRGGGAQWSDCRRAAYASRPTSPHTGAPERRPKRFGPAGSVGEVERCGGRSSGEPRERDCARGHRWC